MTKAVARRGWEAVQTPSQKAVRRLERDDLYLPPKPEGDAPELPADPTELDDSELMSLFARTTAWVEYTGSRLAAAEVDEKSCVDTLEAHKALSAVRNAGQKTVTQAKAKAYEDPEYIEAQEAKTAAYAYRKMVQALHSSAELRNTLLSRELTRRVGRGDREARAGRMSA
jgi:hypothetical protein